MDKGWSWGGVGVGEGSKAIGFNAKELERSRGLSCRTDSIYLGVFLNAENANTLLTS